MPRRDNCAAWRRELIGPLLLSLADRFGEWCDDEGVWWIELGAAEPPRLAAAADRVRRALAICASNIDDDILAVPLDELTEALTVFAAELVYQVKMADARARKAE